MQRHLGNIHKGLGAVIPFTEYLAGRREGKYLPQKVPQYTRSENPFLDKLAIEVENDFARKVAARINKPDDPFYDLVASMVKTHRWNNFLKELKNYFRIK